MKSCCEQEGFDCLQGKNCPVYQKRRVRAGQPPANIDLWLTDNDKAKEELSDIKAAAIVALFITLIAIISAIAVVFV